MSCCGTTQGTSARPAAADPSKHVNFVPGMVLGVDDFTQEFAYLAGRDRWLAREALGYGTLRGLALRWSETDSGAVEAKVKVGAGVALTPCGHLVCVPREQCADLNLWLAARTETLSKRYGPDETEVALDLYVSLAYRERTTDAAPVPGEPCRSAGALMQDARVQDGFTLELAFGPPPAHDEDIAIAAFVAWFNSLPVEAAPDDPATVDTLRQAVRDWAVPQGEPPAPTLTLRQQDVPLLRQEALCLWTTELRPQVQQVAAQRRFEAWVGTAPPPGDGTTAGTRDQYLAQVRAWTPVTTAWPANAAYTAADLAAWRADALALWKDIGAKWFASPCECPPGAAAAGLPDELLLGALRFTIVRTMGNPWQVQLQPTDVALPTPHVDDSNRPLLVHLRMAQAWLEQLPAALPPSPAPSLAAPLASQAKLVAAGDLRLDGTKTTAVFGGLQIVANAMDKGFVTVTFDSYQKPTLQTAWTIKVLATALEASNSVTAQPAVRFHEFTDEGFVLRISRATKLLEVAELQTMRLMLEVTRIDSAP